MRSFLCVKTGFWDINGPKMGCIGDKLIMFFAAASVYNLQRFLSKNKLAINS